MDSLTHIILGAAIGEALLGKKIGRKAALVGALAKTIPDFDLLYTGLKDPRLYMCYHRGHTHSLLWEGLYALPLALLFYWLFRRKVEYKQWLVLFLVCLWGHSLLDTCTNYGTRLFLPLTQQAYSWNNLAIVDLFFTLPMLLLLIVALLFRNGSTWRTLFNSSLLVYCFGYLGMTVLHKQTADARTIGSLEAQHIPYKKFFTNPTILNNILWYGMAVNDTAIYVGEFTLLKPAAPIRWHQYPRHREWLMAHADTADVQLLTWFSGDYDITEKKGDTLQVYCVKFGRTNMKEETCEKTFVMYYKLYQTDGRWHMGMQEPNQKNANMKEGFFDLMDRIHGYKN